MKSGRGPSTLFDFSSSSLLRHKSRSPRKKDWRWIYHYTKCLFHAPSHEHVVEALFSILAHLLCDNDAVNESTWSWQTASLAFSAFFPAKQQTFLIFRDFLISMAFPPHRNALNTFHKIRRHLNEPPQTKPTNSIRQVLNRATYSSSQLSIKVSDLHAGLNGRLEISCMGTIPAKVGKGEMFADYKSYSVKSKCRHLYSFVLKHDLESLEKHKTTIFRLRDFKDGVSGSNLDAKFSLPQAMRAALSRKEWKDLFLIRTTFGKPTMK